MPGYLTREQFENWDLGEPFPGDYLEEETIMSAHRKLSEGQITEAVRRYEAGETTIAIARSFGLHYQTLRRWLRRRIGPRAANLPSFALLMAKTRISESGCHEWQGGSDRRGYGRISIAGVIQSVHRVGYQLHGGTIPEDAQIHHRCANPACWNPDHLEALSIRDHAKTKPVKTHCLRGHEFSPENTRLKPGGRRECKECHRADTRERKRRARAIESAAEARERMSPEEVAADLAYEEQRCEACGAAWKGCKC